MEVTLIIAAIIQLIIVSAFYSKISQINKSIEKSNHLMHKIVLDKKIDLDEEDYRYLNSK